MIYIRAVRNPGQLDPQTLRPRIIQPYTIDCSTPARARALRQSRVQGRIIQVEESEGRVVPDSHRARKEIVVYGNRR